MMQYYNHKCSQQNYLKQRVKVLISAWTHFQVCEFFGAALELGGEVILIGVKSDNFIPKLLDRSSALRASRK